MARLAKKRVRFLRSHRLFKTLAVICIAILVLAILELTNTIDLFHKTNPSKVVVTAGKAVLPPPSSSSSTSQAVQKNLTSGASSSSNSGFATDTKGSAVNSTDSSKWTVSASGLITVKQPSPSATLKDGDTIAGSSKLDQINYRLKDNKVGVIAQGTLSVVNGNFSGTLHFAPQGTGGQLDVFSTDSRGVEYNEVQINVSF